MRFLSPRLILTLALLIVAVAAAVLFIDRPLALALRTVDPQWRAIAEWVTDFGRSTAYLIGFFIAALGFAYFGRFNTSPARQAMARWWAWACLYLFLAVAVPGIVNDVVKLIVGRPRPMVGERSLSPFTFSYDFQSFPSGHAAVAFGLAFAVAALWPRWRWPMLLFAAAVGVSRVILNVHHLGDVIASIIVALLCVRGLSALFARRGLLFQIGEYSRSRRITPA